MHREEGGVEEEDLLVFVFVMVFIVCVSEYSEI